jgi:hypothetical protein
VQLSYFDTFPTNNNVGFNGAWGVYPYLPSGNIIISDIQRGLIVVKEQSGGGGPTPTPTVTNTPTNTPIATATPSRTNTPTPTNTPSAGNTGWLGPTTHAAQTSSAGDNNGYESGPTNAFADGGPEAADRNSGTNKNTSCTNSGKDKHLFYNYNFSFAASQVRGIEVRLDARADSTGGAPKLCVEISWNGGASWTAFKSTPNLTTTQGTYILGGAADTWGRTWAVGDFTNTNFRIRVTDVSNNANRDFFLDWIAVRVSYQ